MCAVRTNLRPLVPIWHHLLVVDDANLGQTARSEPNLDSMYEVISTMRVVSPRVVRHAVLQWGPGVRPTTRSPCAPMPTKV